MISSLLVDENVTKPEKIADPMMKYFCSIGEELSKNIPYKSNSFSSNQIHSPDRSYMITPINAEHIRKASSKFKSSHGHGLDNISSFFLKKGMPVSANGISQMLDLCLSLGKFPDIWKMARVTIIYEDGSQMKFPITDRFLFCLLCLDFLRNWSMINCTHILIQTALSTQANLDFNLFIQF